MTPTPKEAAIKLKRDHYISSGYHRQSLTQSLRSAKIDLQNSIDLLKELLTEQSTSDFYGAFIKQKLTELEAIKSALDQM